MYVEQRIACGNQYFPSTCGSWDSNSGLQAWQQAPLLVEPSLALICLFRRWLLAIEPQGALEFMMLLSPSLYFILYVTNFYSLLFH